MKKLPASLPLGSHEPLAAAFERLDAVCCWVARKHLKATLQSLLSLSGVPLRQFLQLRAVAPEVIICTRATTLAEAASEYGRAAALEEGQTCSSGEEGGEDVAPPPLPPAAPAPQAAVSAAVKNAMSLTEVLFNPPGGAAARVKQRVSAVRQGLLARLATYHSHWAAAVTASSEAVKRERGGYEDDTDEESEVVAPKAKRGRRKRGGVVKVEDDTAEGGLGAQEPAAAAGEEANDEAADAHIIVSPSAWDVKKRKAWHPDFASSLLASIPLPPAPSAALPGWSAAEMQEALAADPPEPQVEIPGYEQPYAWPASLEAAASAAAHSGARVPASTLSQKSYDGEATFYRHAGTFGSLARGLIAQGSGNNGAVVAASDSGGGGAGGESEGEGDRLLVPRPPSSPAPPPLPPCTWDTLEDYLQHSPHYVDQIVSVQSLPAKPPVYAPPEALASLHPALRAALWGRGITRLFAHQQAAVAAALEGKDVVVSTSTSSGKSLTFLLPIFQRALVAADGAGAGAGGSKPPPPTALLLFPTKALAQDQLLSIRRYLAASPALAAAVTPATLDGDTAYPERAAVRDGASLILANPDILHAHVLPGHKNWARLLSNLSFIVIDEAHVYRGVFGAHVALVLRRLLRLCHRVYGSAPQVICCSATIGNPLGIFHALVPDAEGPKPGAAAAAAGPVTAFGTVRRGPVELVRADADSSGCGRRKFLVWNPPLLERLAAQSKPEGVGDDPATERGGEAAAAAVAVLGAAGRDDDAEAAIDGAAAADLAAAVRDEEALYPHVPVQEPLAAGKGAGKRGAAAAADGGDGSSRARRKRGRTESPSPDADKGGKVDSNGEEETVSVPRSNKVKRRRVAASTTVTAPEVEVAAAARPPPPPASPPAPLRAPSPRNSNGTDVPALLDAVGSTLVAPRDWAALLGYAATAPLRTSPTAASSSSSSSLSSSSAPGRDVTSSFALATARRATPALRDPLNYRRSAFAAPYGLAAAAAAGGGADAQAPPEDAGPIPKWVQRWQATRSTSAGCIGGNSRRSALVETANLLTMLVAGGMKTLVFCRVRKVAELLLQYTHERLGAIDDVATAQAADASSSRSGSYRPLRPRVKAYRAGYLVEHRRAIEAELFSGQLLGVVATNALELGVDIGSLDAVVLLGYPPSVSSFWQQSGRAGRGGKDAVTVLVTYDCPIDQHFARHPEELLTRAPESVYVDAGGNAKLLKMHALAAGGEAPLTHADLGYFGAGLGGVLRELRESQKLIPLPVASPPTAAAAAAGTGGAPVLPRPALASFITPSWVGPSATRFSLRAMDDIVYRVWDVSVRPPPPQPGADAVPGLLVDEVEESRAYWEIHPGAMYMNQGATYRVTAFDTATKQAHVLPCAEPYYTGVRDLVDVNAQARVASGSGALANVHLGRVQVATIVYGYRKFWKRSGEAFEECDLHLPPLHVNTLAVWGDVTLGVKRALDAAGLCYLGGCHGAGHALMAVLPLFVACDRTDLGTECAAPMQTRSRPLRFVVYDARPGGGSGLLPGAFPRIGDVLSAALALVQGCDCEDGCIRCIQDASCKEFNYVLDKAATVVVLSCAQGVPVEQALKAGLRAQRGGGGAAAAATE